MFYHNHRRYKDGKRKDKTPMEILTGKEQKKDWIELLFDVVKEKDPNFFDLCGYFFLTDESLSKTFLFQKKINKNNLQKL